MDAGKERIMKTFDEQAEEYDQSKLSRFATQCYPYVLNILLPMQFNNILDIGCGTGSLLYMLLDEKPQVRGYGLDVSEKMLGQARSKLKKHTELVYGEAEALPYDNKKFDVVVMVDSFSYFIDPEQAIKEAYRVLKPGGTLVLADKVVRGFRRIFRENNTYLEGEVKALFRAVGFDVVNLVHNIPGGYIATGDKR